MKRVLYILLAMFLLCSCRTKEKVTERLVETSLSSSTQAQSTTQHSEQQGQTSMTEEATQTSWSDSIVERYHERIVTDSSGRVLLHEREHSKDTYKGKSKSQTNRAGNCQENKTEQSQALTQEQRDSTYNGASTNEVKVVKRNTCWWIWVLVILFGLLAVCFLALRIYLRRW